MKKLLIISVLILCVSGMVFADESKECTKRLISMQGTDYVETSPDTAYFNFLFSIEKDTPEEAARVGEQVKKNVLGVITSQGIEKAAILIDASNVNQRYDYENKKAIHTYSYTTKIKITDFSLINPLRKNLVNETTFAPVKDSWFSQRGLSIEQLVTYEVVTKKNDLEKEALKKAYQNALGKIKTVADISGLKYSIYRINDGVSIESPQSETYRAGNMKMRAAAPVSDESASEDNTTPTLQRITATVQVEAEIQ